MKKMNLLLSTAVLSVVSISAAHAASGIYFDANVGLAQHKWQDGYGPAPGQMYNWKKGNQGLAYGLDLGYQFAQHFAVELGYYKLPTASFLTQACMSSEQVGGDTEKVNLKTNLIYAALRSNVAITQTLDVTLKAGVGKQNVSPSSKTFYGPEGGEMGYSKPSANLSALFGLGLNYKMSNGLQLNAQYLYNKGITSNINAFKGATNFVPDVQMLTVGVGYNFSLS